LRRYPIRTYRTLTVAQGDGSRDSSDSLLCRRTSIALDVAGAPPWFAGAGSVDFDKLVGRESRDAVRPFVRQLARVRAILSGAERTRAEALPAMKSRHARQIPHE
jgi:hypothetical protein